MIVRQAISEGLSDVCAASMRGEDGGGIMAVDARGVPAAGLETLELVDRIGDRQRPVDGNAVVVPEHDQPVQLQMAGDGDGFLRHAFHQVAVGGQHIGAVIDDIAEFRRQHAFGQGHMPTEVARPWPERAGGDFDAGGMAEFGMARGFRAELAEIADLVERHALFA